MTYEPVNPSFPAVPLPSDFTLLQIVPDLDTGGVEQTTLDVARAVRERGGRVLVASRGGRMEAALAAVGGELVRMPVNSKNPLKVAANAAALAELVRREKVSLIHVRSRAPAFSAWGAAAVTGVPLVATYAGVYSAKGPIKRWYNAVMTRGRLIIANSEYTRAHVLAEHGPPAEKVIAIPRGVDLDRFDPARVEPSRVTRIETRWGLHDDGRVRVLLAGRLTRWKGHRLLIEAAQRLALRGRDDFVVLLAGDEQGRVDYRSELLDAIKAAGLGERVRLVGHCEDMPAAYLACDLAVAPSTKPEAFGRTAVEPQLMGRPVIAADHGAAAETVVHGETGWLAAPRSVVAWTEALASALDAGPDRRKAMGARALARARRLYSVEAMCAATLKAYERVLGR